MVTKIYPADLDSPHRAFFIRGLGFIVIPLVRWQIDFLSARIGSPIQLYSRFKNIVLRT